MIPPTRIMGTADNLLGAVKAWEHQACDNEERCRDNPDVIHVYNYVVPVFKVEVGDAHRWVSLVQVRDMPHFSVGVFGGECELWKAGVRDACEDVLSCGCDEDILKWFSQNALRELREEAGFPKAIVRDTVITRQFSERWRAIITVSIAVLPGVCSFRDAFEHVAKARDLGSETLSILPIGQGDIPMSKLVPNDSMYYKRGEPLVGGFLFHKYHDAYFLKACQMLITRNLWERPTVPVVTATAVPGVVRPFEPNHPQRGEPSEEERKSN